MTTEHDAAQATPAGVNDDDDQQNGNQVDDQPARAELDPDDVDAIELAQAAAEAEKEKSGPDGDDGQQQHDQQQGQQPGAKAPDEGGQQPGQQQDQQEDGQQPSPMIPKARLDEALSAQRRAEETAAYWRGQAEARAHQPQPNAQQQQQQPAEPTPAEQVAALRQQQADLAKKFDDGELTMSDFQSENAKLEDQVWEVRQKSNTPKEQPKQPPVDNSASDLYLQERTEAIESQHPYLAHIGNEELEVLWRKASAQLTSEGVDLRTPGPDGRSLPVAKQLALRERIAKLSDEFGPRWTGLSPEQLRAQGQPGSQQQPTQTQQPGKSQAQARADKLTQAAGMPPDVAAMGGASQPSDQAPSDAQLEAMSDEEIAALPDAMRRKVLATTA